MKRNNWKLGLAIIGCMAAPEAFAGGNTPDRVSCELPAAKNVSNVQARVLDRGYVLLLEASEQECINEPFGRRFTKRELTFILAKSEGHFLNRQIRVEYKQSTGRIFATRSVVELPKNIVELSAQGELVDIALGARGAASGSASSATIFVDGEPVALVESR